MSLAKGDPPLRLHPFWRRNQGACARKGWYLRGRLYEIRAKRCHLVPPARIAVAPASGSRLRTTPSMPPRLLLRQVSPRPFARVTLCR